MARRYQNDAERLRKQSDALSKFGGHALRTDDLDALLQEATELVSEAVEVDLVKVLQLLPDGDTMLLRAGVHWKPGIVGHATLGAHGSSPGGYALQTNEAVVSPDTATETRFEIPHLLKEHGVKSMVNVVIRGRRGPWGVLEVDDRRRRDFNADDINFLQNYANLLASAIERLQSHRELEDAAERRRILLGELQHRVKNLLANVRALVKRTRATSSNLGEFAAALDARLVALARTQDLLTRGIESKISLRDILCQELEAHGALDREHVVLTGPDALLLPRTAQALGMAFHELATNASKHGALRRKGGRLDVSWSQISADDGDDMLISWRETGVPIKNPPSHRGFGSETIEQSLPYMIGGTSALAFHPDGLECAIRFPMPKTSEPEWAESIGTEMPHGG